MFVVLDFAVVFSWRWAKVTGGIPVTFLRACRCTVRKEHSEAGVPGFSFRSIMQLTPIEQFCQWGQTIHPEASRPESNPFRNAVAVWVVRQNCALKVIGWKWGRCLPCRNLSSALLHCIIRNMAYIALLKHWYHLEHGQRASVAMCPYRLHTNPGADSPSFLLHIVL